MINAAWFQFTCSSSPAPVSQPACYFDSFSLSTLVWDSSTSILKELSLKWWQEKSEEQTVVCL